MSLAFFFATFVPMKQLVVLITGASSGIGYNAAECLAKAGHKVYGAARRIEKITAAGVIPLRMDVTDEQSMKEGVEAILATEGRIDVLVNNAGFGYFGAIETVPIDEARRQLEVNIFGMARLTQLVLPAMRRQHSGRIINISSIAGKLVVPFGGWYNVSKYSVEAFSDALRMEVRPFGIKVSIIEPGGIKTDWGGIAAAHLNESCAGSAYEDAACRWASLLRKGYGSDFLSDPAKVARKIARAATSRRPRLRYKVGIGSRALPFFHAILPARWWDAVFFSK